MNKILIFVKFVSKLAVQAV